MPGLKISLAVLAFIVFVLICAWCGSKNTRNRLLEFFRLILTMITTAAAVSGVYVALVNLREIAEQATLNVEHERQSAAFDYVERWRAMSTPKAGEALAKMTALTKDEQIVFLATDRDCFVAIRDVFNFFEDLAIAIEIEYANEGILHAYFRDIAVFYYPRLEPIIEQLRTEPGKEGMWVKYEWLYERWKS